MKEVPLECVVGFVLFLPANPGEFGNLPTHSEVREAVKRAVDSGKYEGYGHSCGLEIARKAIAEKFSCPEAPLTAKVGFPMCHYHSQLASPKLLVTPTKILGEFYLNRFLIIG